MHDLNRRARREINEILEGSRVSNLTPSYSFNKTDPQSPLCNRHYQPLVSTSEGADYCNECLTSGNVYGGP